MSRRVAYMPHLRFAQRFVDEAEVFEPGVVDKMIRVEWLALHANGIVAHAPPASGVSS